MISVNVTNCQSDPRTRVQRELFSSLRVVVALVIFLSFFPPAQAEQVVIREIMYHPPGTDPAWVEIENLTATPFDIAEWRFDGKEAQFRFPAFSADQPLRAILKPFERIVLTSSSPDGFRKVHHVSDDIRVFGPWTGELKRNSDRLSLRDKNGVVLCSVRYRDGEEWPIAADGAGHSLVLQNIHEPIDDWRNWKVSTEPAGTPGLPDSTHVLASSVISEVHFSKDGSTDWVEVVHRTDRSDIKETLRLATKRDFSDAVPVPNVGSSGGRVVVDLEFIGGDTKRERALYLVSSTGRVLDAHLFAPIPSKESWQRWPENSREWNRSSTPSRGQINQPLRRNGIVINEIMYDLPADTDGAEFIELFNPSEQQIDLSGWRFSDGVEFEFPRGTLVKPGAFLVISADAKFFSVAHPDIPVFGEYRGKLANEGERVRLVDAVGNLVNETDFRSGGRWPQNAAGGGSSMELVHPKMEGQLPSAWSDSDESGKSEFRTYHHTDVYRELKTLGGVRDYRELHFLLAEEGHVALRNIRLRNSITGEDYVSSTARKSMDGTGNGGWLIQGNHSASHWNGDVLNLVSEGHGDNRANRIEIDVPEMEPGATYELSFDARWISGSARLIAQTWDHSFSYSVRLPIPGGLGTPGRANSQLSSKPIPQLDRLRHSPVVPAPNEPVRISALVTSIESPTSVTVYHRLDSPKGNGEWRSTPMTPESLAPGGATNESREYSAYLKKYSDAGSVVQFFVRVEGQDGTGQQLPADGGFQPALFVVDDQKLPGDLRTSRFIVSARDLTSIAEGGGAEYGYQHPKLSNHYLNGTFISNERDVWYGIDVRRSGSAWNRSETLSRGKWKAPADQLFRGRRKWVFDDDTAGSRRYSDRATRYLLYLLGHPTSENEFVRVIVNAGPAKLREEVEPVDSAFLRRIYPDEEIGELYRVDDEWWFQDSWEEPETRDADWSYKGTDDGGRYRTEWMKRTHEFDDDFSGLINFFNVVSSGAYSETTMDKLIDADAVLKLAAVSGYIANWDTFTMSRGKNAYFYQRAEDGRFRMLHWDSDAAFERESGEPFYGEHEPFRSWMEQPYNLRTFTNYLGEIVNEHTEGSPRMRAWLEAQNLASPDVAIDIPRFESWFQSRNAFARERFGDALIGE